MVSGKPRKPGKPGELVSIETVFGWILNRPVTNKSVDSYTKLYISENEALVLNSDMPHNLNTLDKTLSNFWDLETLGILPDEKGISKKFSNCLYTNSAKRQNYHLSTHTLC